MSCPRSAALAWLLLLAAGATPAVDIAAPAFGYTATLAGPWTAMRGGKPVAAAAGPVTVSDARGSLLLLKEGRLQSVQVEVDDLAERIADAKGLVHVLERKFDSTDLKLKVTAMAVDAKRLQADAAWAIRFEAPGPDDVFIRAAPDLVPVGDLLYLEKGERCLMVLALATASTDRAGNPAPPVFPDADPETAGLFPFAAKR